MPKKPYTYTRAEIEKNRRLLELLSQKFPTIQSASTEIINLEAILNLPKGTEHFVADIHGEYEAFRHILKNASGNIKRKVTELFGASMRADDINQLCTLIYYPRQKLALLRNSEPDMDNIYHITLHQLVQVLRRVSSKYTRSKVRKALPKEFAYIIEELLHEAPSGENKQNYYRGILDTIISTGQSEPFIEAICEVIQRLSIDRLHILGDVYDRGPGAHIIMDTLQHYRDYDIQCDSPIGQPRRCVDGCRRRQRMFHRQRAPHLAPLRQHGDPGRRLRHQLGAPGHVRHGDLRRRPLRGLQAQGEG